VWGEGTDRRMRGVFEEFLRMSVQRRQTRAINGILLLDKPTDISSNHALQIVKRLFAARKAGHTGSLDPLASGMLPICFGEATKFSQYLLEADKRYWVVGKLGVKTTTGDAEGEIVAQQPTSVSAEQLLPVLDKFRGEIQQVPSMFSALKHQGRPLYELARQGITIERAARAVTIHELILLEQTADTITLEISCSKGTYIRTLIEDIGDALGCGAHVTSLRRLSAGTYAANEMVTLQELEEVAQQGDFAQLDKFLLPIDSALRTLPLVSVSEAGAFYLLRGQSIIVPQAPTSGFVCLVLNPDRFLGIGEILSDGRVAPRKLIATGAS